MIEERMIRRNEYKIREMGEKKIIVPINQEYIDLSKMIFINNMGIKILELLKEPTKYKDVVEIILEKFDHEEKEIVSDIELFIELCIENKIITVES